MTDPRDPTSLAARLEALERSVASLTDEVAKLRAELNGRQREEILDLGQIATPSARAPRPASRVPPHPSWTTDEVESVVGRYGMLALATLTGLAAVGTFLGWAITQGLLGPSARVSLGLALAGGLGAAGLRLRRRERSFGATLLGLALATTHLCAWAAGPLLALVPTWASLALATGASIALAAFAHRENDEPLWCVGFGGAALAPFVASPKEGSAALLAAYGLIVMLAGSYALAGRQWPIASRVFAAVTALFVGALMAMPEREGGPLLAIGLPLAVALAGVLPFIPSSQAAGRRPVPAVGRHRGHLRSLGVFAAAASLRAAFATQLPLTHEGVAGVIAAAGLLWLLLVDRTADTPAGNLLGGLLPNTSGIAEWIDGGWVPLGFAVALVVAADAGRVANGALAAGAGLALLVLVARRPAGALRDAAAFGVTACALAAVVIIGDKAQHETVAGAAAIAVLFFVANRVWPSHSWIWVGGVALVMASVATFLLLFDRPPYAYMPFATRASATAFAVAACWAIVARLAPRIPVDKGRTIDAAPIAAWGWAFIWVHQEIARAISPTVSTLLLVTYYASTSVVAVGIGRGRSIAWLRHVGLLLGLIAAFTAMRGARRLEAVWARIAVYLVTSVFLLGIAYWYRKRED
jgi:predicted membrane protein DUF2339